MHLKGGWEEVLKIEANKKFHFVIHSIKLVIGARRRARIRWREVTAMIGANGRKKTPNGWREKLKRNSAICPTGRVLKNRRRILKITFPGVLAIITTTMRQILISPNHSGTTRIVFPLNGRALSRKKGSGMRKKSSIIGK